MEKEPVKIIFLDIDGVLVSLRTGYAFETVEWDPIACALIKKLCDLSGYKIVCSSSWRYDPKRTLEYFKKNGLYEFLHPHWSTLLEDLISRGIEIQNWIANHNVCEFIIIDDDSDMLDTQKGRFIKTNYDDGFSAENYKQAVGLMNIKAGI